MWETWVHKQDETVEFEAREDGDFYEVRPAGTGGEGSSVSTWHVTKEAFLNIYERRA